MRKAPSAVWIEVALNGGGGRRHQPLMPLSAQDIIEEGVACAAAGASIVHFHPYDPATGKQDHEWQLCARIIEGIRARCDALVYPTITMARTDPGYTPAARYAQFAELARRGLVEIGAVDPGSVNFVRTDGGPSPVTAGGGVYANPLEFILEGLRMCAEHGLHPGYAIYEPGFTRLGADCAQRLAALPSPLYRFMFSEEFLWGFPPREAYLEAHVALLREVAPDAPWMVAGLGVNILPLVPRVVAMGGHLRVGLEDACSGVAAGNVALVELAAAAVRRAGAEPATPAEVRSGLAAATAS